MDKPLKEPLKAQGDGIHRVTRQNKDDVTSVSKKETGRNSATKGAHLTPWWFGPGSKPSKTSVRRQTKGRPSLDPTHSWLLLGNVLSFFAYCGLVVDIPTELLSPNCLLSCQRQAFGWEVYAQHAPSWPGLPRARRFRTSGAGASPRMRMGRWEGSGFVDGRGSRNSLQVVFVALLPTMELCVFIFALFPTIIELDVLGRSLGGRDAPALSPVANSPSFLEKLNPSPIFLARGFSFPVFPKVWTEEVIWWGL